MLRRFSCHCTVHKNVDFCLRFRYGTFKTKKYPNNRKVAEAVNRFLSNSVDPLFYLSSFQTLSRKPPVPSQPPGDFSLSGNDPANSLQFLDISFRLGIMKSEMKHKGVLSHVL